MEQEQVLALIEQAIEALYRASAHMPTPVQVQIYLKERHNVDLPIEQIAGNMQIVCDARPE